MKIIHKKIQHEYIFVLMLHSLCMSIKVVKAIVQGINTVVL